MVHKLWMKRKFSIHIHIIKGIIGWSLTDRILVYLVLGVFYVDFANSTQQNQVEFYGISSTYFNGSSED